MTAHGTLVTSPTPRERPGDQDVESSPDAPRESHVSSARSRDWPWLAGALALALVCIGRTMAPAFLEPDVIQDDARQHVFWMLRFQDPELFRGDVIADYFQAVAPPGYAALYRLLGLVFDPRAASRVVPLGLGVLLTFFAFRLIRGLHPAPTAAFLGTVLLSWYVGQYDDLASGSPRAFLLPVLTALLWALVTHRSALAVLLSALGASLYPVCGALAVAILALRLVRLRRAGPPGGWRSLRSGLVRDRVAWLAAGLSAMLVGALVAPGALGTTWYGPTVSETAARTMPEFGPGGRNAFFVPDPYHYWIASYRSGFDLRVSDALLPGTPILFELGALAAILPVLLLLGRGRTAMGSLRPESVILLQVLVASIGLYFLAHLLLFRLYLPARYVQWSVPLVLAISAGLALAVLVDAAARRLAPTRSGTLATLLTLGLAIGLMTYPARYDGNLVRDRHPQVTAYLRAQPPDVVVAGVPTETDSVPALTGRRIIVSREYALAYHVGYYEQIRRRIDDLIDAYYADSPRRLAEFAARHDVDLFIVNRAAFNRETFADAWAGEFEPFISAISTRLRRPSRFALLDLADRCSRVDDGVVAIVPVSCLGE